MQFPVSFQGVGRINFFSPQKIKESTCFIIYNDCMDNQKIITVTSPLLPGLEEFNEVLKEIWASKWITNNGRFHKLLEKELAAYLRVPYISLFTNGTLPLIIALQALRISGEVITTPYSFVATTHSLWWNGIKPVFVDIDPTTGNIDPNKIEAAITPKTTAIMPVHVYGKPCDIQHIQEIADKYGLKVIYDAAHAFGVETNGTSILNAGDMSTLSFHATKVYNTIEGGALVVHDEVTKKRIDYLKNFGFAGETEIVAPGINSKIDEMRAAYGLLNLKQVDVAIEARHQVAIRYRNALRNVSGISFFDDMPGVKHNYSYFPIFINADEYGIARDELYFKMREQNVMGRRYFYPLISTFTTYRGLPSAAPENLPEAHKMADSVICLPMHHALSEKDVERVLNCIIN
jgi:dTDP-4-amino-4,6-dideoxygalactose transaminase